jgi:hypothetical protein
MEEQKVSSCCGAEARMIGEGKYARWNCSKCQNPCYLAPPASEGKHKCEVCRCEWIGDINVCPNTVLHNTVLHNVNMTMQSSPATPPVKEWEQRLIEQVHMLKFMEFQSVEDIKSFIRSEIAAAKAEGGKEMLAKAVEALEKWERDAHENYPDCCKGQCVTYFHAAQIKR